MGFLGVYRAIYDYAPQGDGELAIAEGDILYVLEKGEDDWWKAKKKASGEDEEEPVGLIPSNYVEEVCYSLEHRMGHSRLWIVLLLWHFLFDLTEDNFTSSLTRRRLKIK
jgi:hypothetical protein